MDPSPSRSPSAGQTLGHYRLLERIGAGGMGEVWRARDERLERDVALKLLLPGTLADEAARKRFRREALALSALNHPHIATVFDFNTEAGADFLVMEYVAGPVVTEHLAQGPLPESEVARLGVQLAEGLAAAHAQGIVHRDLKPANVRLTPDGRLKILDFGLAKLVRPTEGRSLTESLTEAQALVGTLAFMAPEQVRGETVDARSDLWAAGLVLYELATGARAYKEERSAQVLYAILNQTPAAPRTLNGRVSAGLEAIILKCLEREPGRRYQSAEELAADLQRLLGGLTVEAERARVQARRVRTLAIVVPVAVVVVLAVLTALNVGGVRTRLFAPPPIHSIAVLPLANLSGDPSQEYFADGMTEALINDLGQVSALRVISWTSAMAYKGAKKPLKQIARELGVDAVVEGSVTRSGDRVKISAQLIRAKEERQLWANSFERDLRDVLALQGEIAGTIVGTLRSKLTPGERTRLAKTNPVNSEAYESYLRGRDHLNREEFEKGVESFRRAIEIDPKLAPAHAGLALCYTNLVVFARRLPSELCGQAMEAARQGVQLDAEDAEGHAALGYAKLNFEWDWSGAEAEFRRAMALNPNSALALTYYGIFLLYGGRRQEAIETGSRLSQIDPGSWSMWILVGAYMGDGRYEDALQLMRRSDDVGPSDERLQCYVGLELCERALGMADSLVARGDSSDVVLEAFIRCGRRDRALAVFRPKTEREFTHPSLGVPWAREYAAMGRKDEAIAWLKRAVDGRAPWCLQITSVEKQEGLEGDPRFERLVRRVGIPLRPAR